VVKIRSIFSPAALRLVLLGRRLSVSVMASPACSLGGEW
jgi:hypothetical protein